MTHQQLKILVVSLTSISDPVQITVQLNGGVFTVLLTRILMRNMSLWYTTLIKEGRKEVFACITSFLWGCVLTGGLGCLKRRERSERDYYLMTKPVHYGSCPLLPPRRNQDMIIKSERTELECIESVDSRQDSHLTERRPKPREEQGGPVNGTWTEVQHRAVSWTIPIPTEHLGFCCLLKSVCCSCNLAVSLPGCLQFCSSNKPDIFFTRVGCCYFSICV